MTIEEIKKIIVDKKYKSYKLGYNEYYIIFNKNYITYVSYIGMFETITYKINKFFKDIRLGVYYLDTNFCEIDTNYHLNDYTSRKISIEPIELFEIISGKKAKIYFNINKIEDNEHTTNQKLFEVELMSSIRKNKILNMKNTNKSQYVEHLIKKDREDKK